MDCGIDHELLKRSPLWAQLPYVGLQRSYAEPDEPPYLEMRNCCCGSTLCKYVEAPRGDK
jgi:hypothetical protein